MTRAKEYLQLLVPQRFYVTQQFARGDRHIYASRTRFIPDALAAKFENLVWPVGDAQGTSARQAGPARIKVRERAPSIWR